MPDMESEDGDGLILKAEALERQQGIEQEEGSEPDEQPSHLDTLEDKQDSEFGYWLDWLEAKVQDGQNLTESEAEELRALKNYFEKT